MKIKLDENMPVALAGEPDPNVWRAAQAAERFFITQDLDFSDLRSFAPGSHHGLLLVRLRQPGRAALRARIRQLFETEEPEQWTRCFVVATSSKIRIRTAKSA
jgi:predicted nuclease of predicted toxin-antitoxin system